MAFRDFSREQVGQTLGVLTGEANLFPTPDPVAVPVWLREILGKRTQLALISEKSRSEFIVLPILMASRELSPTPLAIFSGQRLDVDPSLGLVGECDFILASTEPIPPLRAPIATIVEAKQSDIGWCPRVIACCFPIVEEDSDSPVAHLGFTPPCPPFQGGDGGGESSLADSGCDVLLFN